MNEPMDREELIDAAERSIAWLVQNDPDDTFYRMVTLDNATVQRTLKEALGFLKALRALEETPHVSHPPSQLPAFSSETETSLYQSPSPDFE